MANDWDVVTLILAFAAGWALIAAVTLMIVRRVNPSLKGVDQALVLWFVLCKSSNPKLRTHILMLFTGGSIHFFFEGYFMLNHTRMASMTDFFGQLWKEYSLSDSRYMFSDPFVLCMETVTAVRLPLRLLLRSLLTPFLQVTWGPLSFLTAYLITTSSPYRYPIQALVSTGQFYGDALYYLTSLFDDFYSGKTFYRPEPYYFWFYFVFMNSFWLIVPAREFCFSVLCGVLTMDSVLV